MVQNLPVRTVSTGTPGTWGRTQDPTTARRRGHCCGGRSCRSAARQTETPAEPGVVAVEVAVTAVTFVSTAAAITIVQGGRRSMPILVLNDPQSEWMSSCSRRNRGGSTTWGGLRSGMTRIFSSGTRSG